MLFITDDLTTMPDAVSTEGTTLERTTEGVSTETITTVGITTLKPDGASTLKGNF